MVSVKRIGPWSAFKVGLALYGLVGLIVGLFLGLASMLGGNLVVPAQAGMFAVFFGVGAIIIWPVCYGVGGGIVAAISAAFYNLIAAWVGGLEVDIS